MSLCRLLLLLGLLPLYACGGGLPLFPSRNEPIDLQNAQGVNIRAIVEEVWPDTQNVRIHVQDRGASYVLPMETFNPSSTQKIRDWYLKRMVSESLRVSVTLEDTEDIPKHDLPPGTTSPEFPIYRDISTNTQTVTYKRLNSQLYNTSPYPIDQLTVVYGILSLRTVSKSRSEDEQMTNLTTDRQSLTNLPAREAVQSYSKPARLIDSMTGYDEIDSVDIYGTKVKQNKTHTTIRVSESVSTYYVLVYYKGELVAGNMPRPDLFKDTMKYLSPKRQRLDTQDTLPPEQLSSPGLDPVRNSSEIHP